MWKRDLGSGLFLLLLSVGTCIKAAQLDLGNAETPGPGFIPFGIGAVLGLMSIYLCLQGALRRGGASPQVDASPGGGWKKAALVLVLLTAYAASFQPLGFLVSTFLLMMLLLSVVGRQRLRRALSVSVLTVLCAHLLFVFLFQLPLPGGSLWQWLGVTVR
jgi:putative tricarboxylic transport membrane protein